MCNLIDKVVSLYTYIYIPVETSISEFVKLQNQSMQTLTDSNVKENISANLKRNSSCPPLKLPPGELKDLLLIRRLHETETGDLSLLKIDDPSRRETEVEEILNPKQFYDALATAIAKYGEEEIKTR